MSCPVKFNTRELLKIKHWIDFQIIHAPHVKIISLSKFHWNQLFETLSEEQKQLCKEQIPYGKDYTLRNQNV